MSSPDTLTPVPTASPTAKNASGKTRATPLIKLTLADVIVAIELADGPSIEWRRVLAAAVRSAGRLLNLPLPLIPADPKALLPMLARLTPVSTNRSAKTIDNTRSLVKEALILVGAGRRVRCNGTPLSPAWQTLYGSLPTKRLTNALSRFMHYANQHDVDPEQVNQTVLEQFVADLNASGEVANVAGRHRDVARFWNECVASIQLWPATTLIVPVVVRVRRNLPWDAFPPALSTEVEHYLTWLSGADLLAEDGPPRPCKPTTIRHRRELIRAAASNLVEAGFACNELTSLSVLTDPSNVKRLLRRLLEKNDRKASAFNRGVATELIYIARHHCQRSDTDLDKLRHLRRKRGSLKAGLTKKNRRLLQQLEAEKNLLSLLSVPARLAKEARTSNVSIARRVQMMQIACAIELLFCAPVRLANLAALELGRHLPESLRRGDIHLALAEDEVKNGRPMLQRHGPVVVTGGSHAAHRMGSCGPGQGAQGNCGTAECSGCDRDAGADRQALNARVQLSRQASAPGQYQGMAPGVEASRDRGFSMARLATYLGELACASGNAVVRAAGVGELGVR